MEKKILRDAVTGREVLRITKVNGRLSDENAPAWQEIDPLTGVMVWESWFRDGLQHRDHGAAHIERDRDSGIVLREEWYEAGVLHREHGPAIRVIDPDKSGSETVEFWSHGVKMQNDYL